MKKSIGVLTVWGLLLVEKEDCINQLAAGYTIKLHQQLRNLCEIETALILLCAETSVRTACIIPPVAKKLARVCSDQYDSAETQRVLTQLRTNTTKLLGGKNAIDLAHVVISGLVAVWTSCDEVSKTQALAEYITSVEV